MYDNPSSSELLAAVMAFLEDIRERELKGRDAFMARVSENALSLVQREIEHRSDAENVEAKRLAGLLQSDASLDELRQELVAAIKSGAVSFVDPGLLTHLRETTTDVLKIDQPRYSALKDPS